MEITEKTETNFIRFFGKNTRIKVLDFLIENDRNYWNQGEIMSMANVGHTCLMEVIKELLEYKIIKVENKKYTMNKSNKFAKLLYDIHDEINKISNSEISKGVEYIA